MFKQQLGWGDRYTVYIIHTGYTNFTSLCTNQPNKPIICVYNLVSDGRRNSFSTNDTEKEKVEKKMRLEISIFTPKTVPVYNSNACVVKIYMNGKSEISNSLLLFSFY